MGFFGGFAERRRKKKQDLDERLKRLREAGFDPAARLAENVAQAAVAKSAGAGGVDAMIGIHVHEPGLMLTDLPAGDRLRQIAGAALGRHHQGGGGGLSGDAYVRSVVTDGQSPLDDQEVQARRDAPGMMLDLLRERGLDAGRYEQEVWTEELNPQVKVVWAAARRKR